MPTFTSNRLNVFPMTLSTTASLQELRDAMVDRPPTHHDLEPGWASTNDHGSNLKQYDAAPPASDPRIEPEDNYPERLVSRLYYFVHDTRVSNDLPEASEQRVHFLDAVDVVITKNAPGKYLVLCSSRTSVELRRIERALTEVALSLDDKAAVTTRDSLIAFESPDVFLWLAVQARDKPVMHPDWELLQIFDISGTDMAWGTNYMRRDVDFGRPAFLTAVAEGDSLGPAKLVFKREVTEAKLDLQLFQDGGFTIHVSRTTYRHIPVEEEMRLTAVLDVAFDLVPMTATLHEEDTHWQTTQRDETIAAARDTLRQRYA